MSRKSNKKQGLGAVHKVRHALRGEGGGLTKGDIGL